MTIVGFSFTKVSAEKFPATAKGKLNVNRKCNPTAVEEVKLGASQIALKYSFNFEVVYDPKVAHMLFEGNITQLVEKDASAEIQDMWKKKKTLPPKTLEIVMNGILNRCHVESLLLAKELHVPPPINLPRLRIQQNEAAKPKKK